MKQDIILTTYNRPKLLPRAIKSIINQTSGNWNLWIYDDGSDYDFLKLMGKYKDERIHCFQGSKIDIKDRFKVCRYTKNINFLLRKSSNELVSYLSDDDYYWPEAVERAIKFFINCPDIDVAFGKLTYSDKKTEDGKIPKEKRKIMFPGKVIRENPTSRLDHCQVIHRRECLKYTYWIEDPKAWPEGDAFFFRKLIEKYPFYPIDIYFANSYLHSRALRNLWFDGKQTEDLRE